MKNLDEFKKTIEDVDWFDANENEWTAQYQISNNGLVTVVIFVNGYYETDYTLPNSTLFLEDEDYDLDVQWRDIEYEFKESFEEWGYKHVR